MSRKTLAALLVLLAARPSRAQRVEVVPESAVPSAPTVTVVPLAPLPVALTPGPLAVAAPVALNAAPALTAAPALAPAMAALPAASVAAAAPAPAPAAALAPAAAAAPAKTAAALAPGQDRPRQTLLQSVSAPMADMSKLSGAESASAAENDFAARAQLGGGSGAGAVPAFAAASTPESAPRGSGLLKSSARPAARPASAAVKTSGGEDASGDLTRAALKALASAPAGTALTLDFKPTAKSLQSLTDGVLLYRSREDGRWRLTAAGAAGFTAPAEDFDAAFLGRSESPAPSAADLRASEGRAARFAVAGPRGVVEWNSDMAEGAADALDGTAWGRFLARASGAVGAYPRLLAARGVTAVARGWAAVPADYIEEGASPAAERQLAGTIIPGWMREELPVTAGKIGRAHPPEYVDEVMARSKVWVYTWHSRWTYEVADGLPDGHFDPKFGIRVMLKTDWRKLKDPESHFKVLFAHEYTHWLQNEGLVTRRYGGETPAVAVELLRAIELVGVDGMRAGRVGIIHEGTLKAFDDGRQWAHGDMKEVTSLYYRGLLGGAAYEVGVIAGRPEAAWEFLNLVMAEKNALTPREAFEKVTGVKK